MENGFGNKKIFAENLSYYMHLHGKTRNDLCKDLNLKYTTVTGWVTGEKYPRIDKIELLAGYFGIQKSDLIEERGSSGSGTSSPNENDIKFALFGGEISDEAFEEVKEFAAYIKNKYKKNDNSEK